nr:hypothetical protein [Tanacetum cinerariifolium]
MYWEKSTCPTTLLPPKHHVQVGRPSKKQKRSKHKDKPFVKDGKLSRKGRTITCQSCENTRHNKATCQGQGGNNTKASCSASRQAQQTKLAVGQDSSGGSGTGVVIGLSATAGQGGARGPGGAGIGSQDSDNGMFPMVDEEDLTFKKLALMAEEIIILSEVLKNYISPSNSHLPVLITKSMSVVIDNCKFIIVDEEDLIFKKISPMAEEIMVMLRVCVAKKASDIVWYTDEIKEQVEKVADGWRDTVSYFVRKAVKKYADDE